MRILAIELTTPRAALALLDDDRVLHAVAWEETRPRRQDLFMRLAALRDAAGRTLRDVDLFAVDTGPGSFSGIRVALAAAQAMALPAKRAVAGVSGAAAIAWDVLGAHPAHDVVVAGDARRGCLWAAVFRAGRPAPFPADGFRLLNAASLPAALPPGAIVVTPDWERIGPLLRAHAGPAHTLLEEARLPRAETIALLARDVVLTGAPLPPPAPLYLHPPVLAAPRFPPAGQATAGGNQPANP